ncbi:fatty acyl-AMP ligase [Brucella intermedia]|uniref:fatty acyl-AMP ligase n=1 Tax=Brucella intermedia TaxID=94625 RepID=UPI00124D14E4|nr:fatty acyl-AMP ligase [Brucella intermedia]KAB2719959.1 AMP-binding protein [Brucella intermedia]
MKLTSLPTQNHHLSQRVAEFSSITQALDYAASGETGVCFYDQRGDLTATLTYRDLRERAISTGAKLRSSGLNRGDAVAIIGETAAEFLYLFYGCQYAGLVACPLPYAIYPGGKTSYVNKLAAFIRGGNAKLVCLPDALKELSTDLLQMTGVQTIHYRQLDAVQGDIPPEPLGLDEPAYIQFSSGSTAEPKGIRISQEAACHNVKGILRECIEITSDDRAFSWLPFYHDMGLVGFSIAPLFSQTTVDYIAPTTFARRPVLWLQLVSQNRSTITYAPVFGYKLAAKRLKSSDCDIDLSSLRISGVGGDMINVQELYDFAHATATFGFQAKSFTPSYGLAESTLLVSFRHGLDEVTVHRKRLEENHVVYSQLGKPDVRSLAICGRPLNGHQIIVCDTNGSPVPEHRIGHICIRGPSLMSGYCDESLPPMKRIVDANFFDTGDAGFIRDGELVVTGRFKEMIVVNGRNIWPQDVERAVKAVSELQNAHAAAFAVDEDNSEVVVVLVECGEIHREDTDALKLRTAAAVNSSIGVTPHVELVRAGSLPFTSSGKLSRSGARKAYIARLLSYV